MRRSAAEIYLHFVWATARRNHVLCGELERAVHRTVEEQARAVGCSVLAIGGMPDHVYVLVKVPATVAPAALANRIKGVASRMASAAFDGCEDFAWQEGYGAFSVCRNHVGRVTRYIERQKEHHAAGKLWQTLERDGEDIPDRPPPECAHDSVAGR